MPLSQEDQKVYDDALAYAKANRKAIAHQRADVNAIDLEYVAIASRFPIIANASGIAAGCSGASSGSSSIRFRISTVGSADVAPAINLSDSPAAIAIFAI